MRRTAAANVLRRSSNRNHSRCLASFIPFPLSITEMWQFPSAFADFNDDFPAVDFGGDAVFDAVFYQGLDDERRYHEIADLIVARDIILKPFAEPDFFDFKICPHDVEFFGDAHRGFFQRS